jgi:hypothetical protein
MNKSGVELRGMCCCGCRSAVVDVVVVAVVHVELKSAAVVAKTTVAYCRA